MKKLVLFGMLLAIGTSGLIVNAHAESLASLRGAAGIPEMSTAPVKARVINDKENVDRTFEEQPPLIPHKSERYAVNLKQNECMDCHSKEKAKEKEASAVSESHYESRDGKKLDSLAARRYFCNQCHVPQVDAQPLVDNAFRSIKVTKK